MFQRFRACGLLVLSFHNWMVACPPIFTSGSLCPLGKIQGHFPLYIHEQLGGSLTRSRRFFASSDPGVYPVYSPEIDPLLVRPLYYLGKARKQPMTALVNEIIFRALVAEELTDEAARYLDPARFKYSQTPNPQPRKAAA